MSAEVGRLEHILGEDTDRWQKQVRYHVARVHGESTLGDLPEHTRQRRWLRAAEVDELPLVSEDLRPLLRKALEPGATNG